MEAGNDYNLTYMASSNIALAIITSSIFYCLSI
jgi:hypothetical protein